MILKLEDDCFVSDKDRLPHAEAIAILKARVTPVVGEEEVPLDRAHSRYLAKPIVAPRAIPGHDNAAVDGYAFAHSSYDKERGASFRIVGQAAAGHPHSGPSPAGSTVRIFTGAVMPDGLDTVAMQEDVRIEDREGELFARIPPGLKPGTNRRLAGEDTRAGEVLVNAGAFLRPQDLASAAACGFDRIACHARLKVGIVSTGDEILRPGAPYQPGKVYDANAPMLLALCQACGTDPIDLGVLPDDAARVRKKFEEAAKSFNVLVVSGGASQGAEDHVVRTLDEIGKRHLWQIAIKPGRPMSFGQIGDCVVLGLPGNPVAVFVCFLLYVRPVLTRLAGGNWLEPVRYKLPAAFEQTKKAGRREFWRAKLEKGDDGSLTVSKFARDGSGLISSLRESDGLIEVAEDVTKIDRGNLVDFIPYSEFGLTPSTAPR
jgi:molybdopterin molybdotransferase